MYEQALPELKQPIFGSPLSRIIRSGTLCPVVIPLILELRIFPVGHAPVPGRFAFDFLTYNIVHDAFVPELSGMKPPEIGIRLFLQQAGNVQQHQSVVHFTRCYLRFYPAPDLAPGSPIHQHRTCRGQQNTDDESNGSELVPHGRQQ